MYPAAAPRFAPNTNAAFFNTMAPIPSNTVNSALQTPSSPRKRLAGEISDNFAGGPPHGVPLLQVKPAVTSLSDILNPINGYQAMQGPPGRMPMSHPGMAHGGAGSNMAGIGVYPVNFAGSTMLICNASRRHVTKLPHTNLHRTCF